MSDMERLQGYGMEHYSQKCLRGHLLKILVVALLASQGMLRARPGCPILIHP